MQSDAGSDQGVNGGDSVAPSGMPVPGVPPTIATESVTVSGSNSPSLAGMGADELRAGFQVTRWEAFPALRAEPWAVVDLAAAAAVVESR